jgi:hypothetical protein
LTANGASTHLTAFAVAVFSLLFGLKKFDITEMLRMLFGALAS